jgi:hypothetical protein
MTDVNAGGAPAPADNAAAPAEGAGVAPSGAAVQNAAPAPAAEPSAWDWSKAPGVDPDSLGYVQSKGWKTVGDLVGSYRNAEKALGVPADQIIKLPKERTDATMGEIYDKLGRPKDASGYTIKVPEQGGDPEFAKQAATWFHETGLNQGQVEKLTGKWNEHIASVMQTQQAQIAERDTAQIAEIKRDWGPQEQANLALVDRAAKAFGMGEEEVTALRQAMGPGKALKFLHSIGSKLGVDDTFVNGDGTPNGFGGMTPEQAKSQITELRKDNGFLQRFSNGDTEARKQMSHLHRVAYPEG